ncbi:hypothetical protein GCM10027282_07230 [Frigoribacterium salinisoli]
MQLFEMTSQQQALWTRITVTCAVVGLALRASTRFATQALSALLPLGVTLLVLAVAKRFVVRRHSRF